MPATAKITAVDVSKLTPADPAARAEATVTAEIVVGGQTYRRRFTIVSDDHYIHHVGGPITQGEIERLVLAEADKLQSLHDAAAAVEARKDIDLVTELERP